MPLSCPVYSPAECGSEGGGERLNLPGLEKTEQAAALQQRTLPLGVGVSAVQVKRDLDKNVNSGTFLLKLNIIIGPMFCIKLILFVSIFQKNVIFSVL